jgi:hypothetical protein
MARQPYMGLGLLFQRLRGLCAFAAVRDRLTGRAFRLDPDVTVRAIWQCQETWVRNGRLNLAYGSTTTGSSSCPKVLLHAVNLRHGTDGFTSPPKEVVLQIFITLKNPSTSVGIEPANLGSSGEHANH